MNKFLKASRGKTVGVTVFMYVIAVAGLLLVINSCKKASIHQRQLLTSASIPAARIMSIAAIRPDGNGNYQVLFNERQSVYTLPANSNMLPTLQSAYKSGQAVKVVIDAKSQTVLQLAALSAIEQASFSSRKLLKSMDVPHSINTDPNTIDKFEGFGVPFSGAGVCADIIPDIATAQLIFNYCSQQSCSLPSPYSVPYCIPFQFVGDGCYARAQEMCYLIENKFHYCSQKVFSFANHGSDILAVEADKWGGCCVLWWYHVTPLIAVRTPTGPKAYVIDPGMFDQPVLLSTWLNAQKNKNCSGNANVSMFTIQPSSTFWPADYTGTTFETDSTFANTDTTFVDYKNLVTCP